MRLRPWKQRGAKRGRELLPVELPAPLFFVLGATGSAAPELAAVLDAHPEVLCRSGAAFFGAADAAADRSLERALLDSEPLRAWAERSSWTRHGSFDDVALFSSALVAASVMNAELSRDGSARIAGGESSLNGPGVVASIGRMLPSARIIHVTADGDRSARAARQEGSRLGPDRYLEMGGEDVVARDLASAVRTFAFLGVDASEAQARRCLESSGPAGGAASPGPLA